MSIVRCAVKSLTSSVEKQCWALKSTAGLNILPFDMTVESIHKMNWSEMEKCAIDTVQFEDVSLLPLFDRRPDKILGIGLNYRDHLEEQRVPLEKYPQEPVVFNKFASTVICHGETIKHPTVTNSLDYEVELAVIMGAGGRHIKETKAIEHVFGYTIANDITARDWQKTRNNKQWILGKSMDTFCPLGPAIVTKEVIADPHNLDISCSVNGEVRQSSNTKMLLFKIPQLISYISSLITLHPGDVILTGTPGGVGAFREPPQFLQPGDTVKCTIEHIGELENTVEMET